MAEITSVNSKESVVDTKRNEELISKEMRSGETTEGKTSKEAKDTYTPSGKTNNTDDYTQKIAPSGTKKSNKEEHSKTKDTASSSKELTDAEKQQVEELKKIDDKTKAHEAAHIAAGGNLVKGGANYTYEKGPDGKSYAVGGEVNIDISPEKDPDDTILKMSHVRRAALAPADPSAQDRQVASKATQIQSEARTENIKEAMNTETGGNTNQSSESMQAPESTQATVIKQEEQSDDMTKSDNRLKSEQITRTYVKSQNIEADSIGVNFDIQISEYNQGSLKENS